MDAPQALFFLRKWRFLGKTAVFLEKQALLLVVDAPQALFFLRKCTFLEKHYFFGEKRVEKKLSSDPRDLSHELRDVPELLGTAGVAQNGWMASISRPFLVKFGDFEFPAALAHFSSRTRAQGPGPGPC